MALPMHERRSLLGLWLLLPLSASASGPPPGTMIYIYGVMPLLLCLVIYSIYLLFSRHSWRQRFQLLGAFAGLGAIIGVMCSLIPNYVGHWFSFLMWLAPPFMLSSLVRDEPER